MNLSRTLACVLVSLAAALSASSRAQDRPQQVDAPRYSGGETWKWTYEDILSRREPTWYVRSVRHSDDKEAWILHQSQSGNRYWLRWGPAEGRPTARVDYSADGPQNRGSKSTELSPESYELQFPLSVGKKYTHKTSVPGASGRIDIDMKAEVIGWEQVETPAGKFDALRVDFVGYWESQSALRSRAVRDMQVWYAPAAKTIVRVAAKSFAEVSRRPMADWATQLVEFKVGP